MPHISVPTLENSVVEHVDTTSVVDNNLNNSVLASKNRVLFIVDRELKVTELEALKRFGSVVMYYPALPALKDIEFKFLVVNIYKGRKWLNNNLASLFASDDIARVVVTNLADYWVDDCKPQRVMKKLPTDHFKFENFINDITSPTIRCPTSRARRFLKNVVKLLS
jgi:hypothetical protein